jgi:hypothetical protein
MAALRGTCSPWLPGWPPSSSSPRGPGPLGRRGRPRAPGGWTISGIEMAAGFDGVDARLDEVMERSTGVSPGWRRWWPQNHREVLDELGALGDELAPWAGGSTGSSEPGRLPAGGVRPGLQPHPDPLPGAPRAAPSPLRPDGVPGLLRVPHGLPGPGRPRRPRRTPHRPHHPGGRPLPGGGAGTDLVPGEPGPPPPPRGPGCRAALGYTGDGGWAGRGQPGGVGGGGPGLPGHAPGLARARRGRGPATWRRSWPPGSKPSASSGGSRRTRPGDPGGSTGSWPTTRPGWPSLTAEADMLARRTSRRSSGGWTRPPS